ncbi:MAG: methyltransferase domain-containing protein [Planctomycetota bacterium]|nr:methyltransferase domain-containing protein [Planctomycetota bacterium]
MSIWLGGDEPHEPAVAGQQDDWLRGWAERPRSRVLDLGCGHGRTMLTLAAMGHEVIGVDRDQACLAECRSRADALGVDVRLECFDFLTDDWPGAAASCDLICCLGNTFMLVDTDEAAVVLLRRCAARLAPDGAVVLDDLPGLFVPEVESGNWQTGLSEDGSLQFIWSDRDDVFTVRSGGDVDPEGWTLGDADVPLRLWRRPALERVAAEAGLSVVEVEPAAAVLVMRSGGPVPAG